MQVLTYQQEAYAKKSHLGYITPLNHSLYAWMMVYNCPRFSSFTEFLDLCSFSLHTSCVLELRSFALSNEINLLIK